MTANAPVQVRLRNMIAADEMPYRAGIAYRDGEPIDYLAVSARTAATKVPNSAYRGAGRPEAAFAMERIIDLVAGNLGLEPIL